MKMLEREPDAREWNLDLIRAAAAVLVLAVHFFLNAGFYEAPLQGSAMLLSAALRMACMTCVPLFMTLTGYLCVKYRWSRGYYRKLFPVLLTWLLAGCACLFFRMAVRGEPISGLGVVRRLLDFSAAPYGWYVEMYIGLFLLAPFLNAAWHALEERGRGALLLTLIVMTALPAATNLAGQILPDWWSGVYPLTYYVLGAWLRERPVRWKRRWLLAGWLALALAAGLIRFGLSHGGTFVWAAVSDWGSLLVLGETVCLFSCLRSCTGEKLPRAARWCVSRVARLSLPIYLTSYITDQIIYPPFCAARPTMASRLPFFPLMVLASAAASGLMAQAVDWAARAAVRLIPGGKREEKACAANCSKP